MTFCKTLWTTFHHISQFSTEQFAPLSLILCCIEMKNIFLVPLRTAGTVKMLDAPLHQLVSLISGCCLLSLLWLINLHTVRTLSVSSVMAAVQFYPNITVFSAPSFFTFNTGPSSNISGGRLGVSSFHDL